MLTGRFAERYLIERALSEGGMGTVYIALDERTSRKVAIKVMNEEFARNQDAKHRFEQEAKIVARLNSEHIVDVRDFGFDPHTGAAYLAMELLVGADLDTKMRESLPTNVRAEIVAQLLFGVRAAHEQGVVHRDLKPANVFLHAPNLEGGKFVVKILDFGIAKDTIATGNKTSTAVGTPFWMAPEQTNAATVTPASDVWALGLIAYFVFVGKEFWHSANDPDATVMAIMRELCVNPIPPATVRANEAGLGHKLPQGFDAWFAKALERDPAARFQDAREAWEALAPIVDPLRYGEEGGTNSRRPPALDAVVMDPSAAGAVIASLRPASDAARIRSMATQVDEVSNKTAPRTQLESSFTSPPPSIAGGKKPLAFAGVALLFAVGVGATLFRKGTTGVDPSHASVAAVPTSPPSIATTTAIATDAPKNDPSVATTPSVATSAATTNVVPQNTTKRVVVSPPVSPSASAKPIVEPLDPGAKRPGGKRVVIGDGRQPIL